jgi:hypothetical protein
MPIAFIKDSNNYYTVVINNKVYQFDETHPKYESLVHQIKRDDEDSFVDAFDVSTNITNWAEGHFKVMDGILRYKDNEIHRVLADRILDMIKEKFNYRPMLKFVERLYKNPSHRAINELYNFLAHQFLPIDPDGYFLAYKAVTSDFKDKHTKTVDNSVGAEPEMERFKVDDNCDVACSQGYHVGAHKYASEFRTGDDVMVICRVDPADVVSIPKDCNQEKLRCCKYKVVGIYEGPMTPAVVDTYSETKVEKPDEDEDEEDDFDDEDFDDYDDWGDDEECDDSEDPF